VSQEEAAALSPVDSTAFTLLFALFPQLPLLTPSTSTTTVLLLLIGEPLRSTQ
jgi:hypothetical protein